ncbi:GNAT family N-acetyltransferase [Streptomyces pseudovenezuelae]|uniref:GNAT superfamily N-acetyltransferase n=1 Tax=Streptomyces pseudovenezuelae TaxID=67350 RepID=A0ABT6LI50_9ACTN|nr:GNAT family N-acetyltransferase [Streptomyces pseudovenezuelae]MDH6215992.1 GNAT superfamily N-acetyltransferase [Streptomyces pseudovenezuelae]
MEGLRLERRAVEGLDDIRQQLLDVYAEIYADRLSEEFHSVERFDERLGWNTEIPGFAAVVGYLDDTPVGYAYGCVLQETTRWWNGLRTPVPADATTETGTRTFALSELMVVEKARGTGLARHIHDALLRDRIEERVTLLVERDHPKVRALYESWGYEWFGEVMPFEDAPLYDALMLQAEPAQS